uniref:Kinesin-like protein n=1 Tax=Caenorhabditis japonica TaxID=281687 RepID=A0A8R1HRZ0_CAEJA
MGKGDSILVAVRVRPFNDREKTRNCKLVIEMPDEGTTVIRDPKTNEEKRFTYDHSYWSHDGFSEKKNGYFEPTDAHYADQKRVFEDLGRGVLANAWAGYNCSLFAYGQTGSGKSYSIVGFKNNKGIVPIVCEELFKQITEKKKKNMQFEVFVSMMEIYCEKVRDLLTTTPPPKGGLKVREHPKNGFYVENLTTVPVNGFKEIETKIEEGTKNRTIAATQMNATSSRAHTIFKITFNQKSSKQGGGASMKKSEINLVDLAGSERQSAAGTEGDRLKEGIVINQSLTTLGRVIKALHDSQKANGGKKTQIPYRDSVLTCLLKNALGGNSKTIMIAAISPADINYEETLSTLRFADRAKSIKTNAVVNENQTERALRELREENLRLQGQIQGGGDGSNEEIEKLRQQLAENQKEMEEMEKSWQQKIAEEASKHIGGASEKAEMEAKKKKMCHLWNLNEDPALTNVIVHFIPIGDTVVDEWIVDSSTTCSFEKWE